MSKISSIALLVAVICLPGLSAFAQTGPAISCSNGDQSVKIEYGESETNLPKEEILWVEVDGNGFESTVKSKFLVSTETGADVYVVQITGRAGTLYTETVVCK